MGLFEKKNLDSIQYSSVVQQEPRACKSRGARSNVAISQRINKSQYQLSTWDCDLCFDPDGGGQLIFWNRWQSLIGTNPKDTIAPAKSWQHGRYACCLYWQRWERSCNVGHCWYGWGSSVMSLFVQAASDVVECGKLAIFGQFPDI